MPLHYRYNAAEDDWALINEAPRSCITIFPTPDWQPKLCVTRGGSILRQDNDRWVPELIVE